MERYWIRLGLGLALFAVSCNKEEAKQPPKPIPAPEAPAVVEDEPELIPLEEEINSPSPTETKAVENVKPVESVAPVTNLSSGPTPQPSTSGDYVIQVGTSSSDRDAQAMIKRIAKLGFEAYTVEVYNPGNLEGRFIRVRLGYFRNVPDARQFGHNVLKPEGITFWIDNRKNDNNSTTNQAVNYEEPAPQVTTPTPEPVKEEIKPQQSADIVEDEWGEPVAPAKVETPKEEVKTQVNTPAPAPKVETPAPTPAPETANLPVEDVAPADAGWDSPAVESNKKKAASWDDQEGWE